MSDSGLVTELRIPPAEALVTPSATIYVLDCDHGTKVGITIQSIEQRVADLERGSGLRDIRIVRTWPFTDRARARLVERGAHFLLRHDQTISEWFHCHPLTACDAVEHVLLKGIPLGVLAPEVAA